MPLYMKILNFTMQQIFFWKEKMNPFSLIHNSCVMDYILLHQDINSGEMELSTTLLKKLEYELMNLGKCDVYLCASFTYHIPNENENEHERCL
mmetsp:Transcript_2273/g.2448  ORF Transcript_2273/g.2448 Transcript_2273/m.2448 type:complete len:93 (+) Transcript_2273:120-398(+)